jgi:GNAT superfamily N-acetyltransferase
MPYDYMQKILNYQRENGCRGLLRACLTSLKHTLFFYEKEVIGGLSVANSVFSIAPKIPVIVRPAAMSDVPDLKVLTTGYKKRDFPQWIRDGYIFYLAQLTAAPSSIIGYICVCPATKARHKLVSILKLRETDYWAIDAFIHPDYRRKGINSAIASGFLGQAKREGYKRGYGTILTTNKASRKSYGLIGEKEIGAFTTLTILGCTFHFVKRNMEFKEFFTQ